MPIHQEKFIYMIETIINKYYEKCVLRFKGIYYYILYYIILYYIILYYIILYYIIYIFIILFHLIINSNL